MKKVKYLLVLLVLAVSMFSSYVANAVSGISNFLVNINEETNSIEMVFTVDESDRLVQNEIYTKVEEGDEWEKYGTHTGMTFESDGLNYYISTNDSESINNDTFKYLKLEFEKLGIVEGKFPEDFGIYEDGDEPSAKFREIGKKAGEASSDSDSSPTPDPSSTETSPSSGSGSAYTTQSYFSEEDVRVSIVGDTLAFGFQSNPDTTLRLSVEDEMFKKPLGLEMFASSFAPKDDSAYALKFNHYVLIKGLVFGMTYEIKATLNANNQELKMKVTPGESDHIAGSYEIESVTVLDSGMASEYNAWMFNSSHKTIEDPYDFCNKNSLDDAVCTNLKFAAEEEGNMYYPEGSESKADSTGKLIDSFFDNKPILYTNMALIALLIILEIIHLMGSQSSFGVVFDSSSKKPVGGAVVRIFNEETNKLLETKVSDNQGKYTFLVKPGKFYIEVVKDGFRFPSKTITGKDTESYSNLYGGEIVKIFKNNALLSPNIAIDKLGTEIKTDGEEQVQKASFITKLKSVIIRKLRVALLIIVTLVNVGVVIFAYVPTLVAILGLIAVVWLMEGIALFRRGYR